MQTTYTATADKATIITPRLHFSGIHDSPSTSSATSPLPTVATSTTLRHSVNVM